MQQEQLVRDSTRYCLPPTSPPLDHRVILSQKEQFSIEIEMYGGGGGGGAGHVAGGRGGSTHKRGGGGGGGAYVRHKLFIAQLVEDAVINFTVGAGGAGGGNGGGLFPNDGVDGGDTTLVNIVAPGGGSTTSLSGPSAGGGAKGLKGNNNAAGGQVGVAADGNITNTNGSAGGSTVWYWV